MTISFIMNALIPKQCLKLEDVQRYLIECTPLRLPEDVAKKATDASTSALTFEDSTVVPFATNSSVLRIALMSVAATLIAKDGDKFAVMAMSIVNLLNAMPKLDFKAANTGSFDGTIFDIDHAKELTNQAFQEFLVKLFAPLELNDAELEVLNKPFILAAEVLLTTALSERLIDYATIVLCLEGEISGAQDIPSDQYTRENSPLYMSKTAQNIRGFVNGSKLIKKKGGSDKLMVLVDVISPLFGTIANIRTNIAKAQYFYSKLSLQTHQNNLLQGIELILKYITNDEAKIDIQNATKALITAVYNKYLIVKEEVDQRQAK